MEMWTVFGVLAVVLIVIGVVSAGLLAKRADEIRGAGHGHH